MGVPEEKSHVLYGPELISSVIRAFDGGFYWGLPSGASEGYTEDQESSSIVYQAPLRRKDDIHGKPFLLTPLGEMERGVAVSGHVAQMIKVSSDPPGVPKSCFFPSALLALRLLSYGQNTEPIKVRKEVAQLRSRR